MKITRRNKCKICGQESSFTECFCDWCKKELNYKEWNTFGNENILELILVIENDYDLDEAITKDFCCWTCLLNFMKSIPSIKDRYTRIEFPDLEWDCEKEFIDGIK